MTLGAWSSPTLIFLPAGGAALLPSSTVLARPTTAIDDRFLTADDDEDEIDIVDLVGEILAESTAATLVGAGSLADLLAVAEGLGI